jgi:hypothetical protein
VALRRRGFVSVGAAVACCALAAACTPEPAPARTSSPTPAATTAPSESQIERQMRLDYEAAEKAYRANMAEQDRLYQAGGAVKATHALKATATGSYLRITLQSLRDVRKAGWHAIGGTKIVGVVRNRGWNRGRVDLTSCEDNETVRFVDKSGRDVTPKGPALYVQALTVIREGGRWKVSTALTTKVKTFEGQPCGL